MCGRRVSSGRFYDIVVLRAVIRLLDSLYAFSPSGSLVSCHEVKVFNNVKLFRVKPRPWLNPRVAQDRIVVDG